MKPINVLLACSSIHAVGIIRCLLANPDNIKVNVYVANCNFCDLPPENLCAGRFVVPRLIESDYIPTLLQICKENSIDIILPTSSQELELMALAKDKFDKVGVRMVIAPLEAIRISGNKSATYDAFKHLMPKQIVTNNAYDVLMFSENVKHICCKPTNSCGGKGFAIVDENKCTDPQYFHSFGKKHYISLWQLCHSVELSEYPTIIQEYNEGVDYSFIALADGGRITHSIGCYGTTLEFGAVMRGEIGIYPCAMQVAELVAERLNVNGPFGLDFIICGDGRAVLLDVNMRVTASAEFYAKAGVNIPWLSIKQALGYNIREDKVSVDYELQMVKYFDAHYYHN